ncbi:nucleolar protein 6 [Fistulifera solaris]|jgi:RNA recognition motif-containing protein|uniref:Nucleolar protein 6 n=1 Tax=Fistulifera solaris TaxID=1519565 RepID=A0A1Z5JMP2_FISSO|nr:nucleolar protein 6 [Fistulifera solaris]|eukprot:GAX15132.1 nucleolar protein 6 [Fistulifera solaris]
MPKKSKAQIKRLAKRAEARGEVYEPPLEELSSNNKLLAARQLQQELTSIEKDDTMKAKDRRSAKRKAEAIALEKTGCSADELLAWYKEQKEEDRPETNSNNKKKTEDTQHDKRKIPYILFIGQLSYDTTKESLLQHFQTELADDGFDVNEQTCQIRLLTDPKTKKSRGMAFVELSTPELMHACLKLHKTMLEGRRINVEKSAGGGKHSEQRKEKLKTFRTQQEEYIESMVAKMIDEYKQKGEIQDGELDEGVIALCQRHSGAVVQAALERYVDSNGREMDNPSAYLSFLLGKLAHEGIYDSEKGKKILKSDSDRPPKRVRSN